MSLLVDLLSGRQTERPPVWFMRQAGRCLASYRELREKHGFLDLMRTPELATEVTLQPIRDLNVDAAILFSDILTIPEALGMDLKFEPGPKFTQTLSDLPAKELLGEKPERLEHVYDALKMIKKVLPEDRDLIGFCGAPLTVFCYMAENGGTREGFPGALSMIYGRRKECESVLDAITEMSIRHAEGQIKAGAQVFQLFETWAGIIPSELYLELILPRVRSILKAASEAGARTIFFPRGCGTLLAQLPEDLADGISIDWQTDIRLARKWLPKPVLQGNIDPRAVLAGEGPARAEKERMLKYAAEDSRLIVNLGHGVLPGTDEKILADIVASVRAFRR